MPHEGYLTLVLPEMLVMASQKLTTTVSTKGQVILPKAIREQRRWRPGTRLVVENTARGVILIEARTCRNSSRDDHPVHAFQTLTFRIRCVTP